jgi:hypothetical protein
MSAPDDEPRAMQWTTVPIPAYLWSIEAEAPFSRCLDCQRPLLMSDPEADFALEPGQVDRVEIGYQIQKLIVRGEPVFEYALCAGCMQQLSSRFSEETKQAISQFVQSHLQAFPVITPHEALAGELRCLICQRPKAECYRYSLMSYCLGPWLLINPGPAMVCDECEEDLSGLISEKTRREWDRFVEDHFDSPPGVEADSPRGVPMLI